MIPFLKLQDAIVSALSAVEGFETVEPVFGGLEEVLSGAATLPAAYVMYRGAKVDKTEYGTAAMRQSITSTLTVLYVGSNRRGKADGMKGIIEMLEAGREALNGLTYQHRTLAYESVLFLRFINAVYVYGQEYTWQEHESVTRREIS